MSLEWGRMTGSGAFQRGAVCVCPRIAHVSGLHAFSGLSNDNEPLPRSPHRGQGGGAPPLRGVLIGVALVSPFWTLVGISLWLCFRQ
jgi:hypothetical protein